MRSGERHQAGGGSGGYEAGGERPAEDEEIFSFFSTSCFSGFGDGPKVRGGAGGERGRGVEGRGEQGPTGRRGGITFMKS